MMNDIIIEIKRQHNKKQELRETQQKLHLMFLKTNEFKVENFGNQLKTYIELFYAFI